MGKRKTKTLRQVRYLLSKVSPLTTKEKKKLKAELHSKRVKIRSSKKVPRGTWKRGKRE
jgi:hypothetical protein